MRYFTSWVHPFLLEQHGDDDLSTHLGRGTFPCPRSFFPLCYPYRPPSCHLEKSSSPYVPIQGATFFHWQLGWAFFLPGLLDDEAFPIFILSRFEEIVPTLDKNKPPLFSLPHRNRRLFFFSSMYLTGRVSLPPSPWWCTTLSFPHLRSICIKE